MNVARSVLILLVLIWSYVPGILQHLHKLEHHSEEPACILSHKAEDPKARHYHPKEEKHCVLCEYNFHQDTYVSNVLPELIFSFSENSFRLFVDFTRPNTFCSVHLRGPPVLA
ncbi:MAG: hypothetical protein IT233_11295 [Bacteroidia bacterium]|nr:hypothetical protein [Bacteroidia bacterium]